MRPPRLFLSITIKSLIWLGAIAVGFVIAGPARADFAMPEVPGFSNNYPWFNSVSQYPGDQSFQYFLAYHPNIAQALARNPSLLYNARWRYQFPALEQYLANHPDEWQALSGEDWAEGSPETSWGGYDQEHHWRDAYWWHANDPNWFYDNHQDWSSLDSRWLTQDGAYDAQHQWHYGEWWYNQNPNWVTAHHPNWLAEHRDWGVASEQQSYRKQHAMRAPNQDSRRQVSAVEQASTRQPNVGRTVQHPQEIKATHVSQQRAIDQRQASLQHQQSIQQMNERQHQAQRPGNEHQKQAKRDQSPETRRQVEPANRQAGKPQEVSRNQHPQEPKLAHEQHDQRPKDGK